MKTLTKRTARLLAAGAFFICLLAPPVASAYATAETDAAAANTAPATSTAADAYSFTAKKGDSLSKLARRALQLYQEDKKLTLTPAAAVYGETTVVQALGGSYLEIGQHVDIPSALLQSAVDSSKTLSAAQLKRWDQYAANVSFDVSYIEAEKPTAAASSVVDNEPEGSDEAQNEENQDEKTNGDKESASAYWWFVGAGALIVLYFVLGGQTPRPRKR